MPPPRHLLAMRLCSTSVPDPAHAPTRETIFAAADVAKEAVLRSPWFESRLLSLLPPAVLFHPDCVRRTLSRILPYTHPSLSFLLFLSAHLPARDGGPAPEGVLPLMPKVDAFLLQLPPPLAADAAEILSSRLGLHPSISALYTVSNTALRAARPDLVFRLYAAFSTASGFPADAGIISCLVRACVADRRPLEGLQLLRDAARRGFPPSADAVEKLVGAFSAVRNFDKVSETLHLMIAAGGTPDVLIYGSIIHHLFVHQMGGEALRVFREIKLRGYAIDRSTYVKVIDGLCKMRRIGEAMKLWDEMVNRGIVPNEYAYCSLVNYHCQVGDFEKARKVYDEMLDEGFKECLVSCNIFIKGLCAHGRFDEAFSVFDGMVTKGIKHHVSTYNTLILGLCNAGKLTQAIKIYEQLLSSGLEPIASTFSPLIDAMCDEGQVDAAVDLVRVMQAKGLEPSFRSNDSIINGFCKINRSDEGMAWLAAILKSNMKPQKETLNLLVVSLSKAGRLDDALLVLSIMFKIGFELSRFASEILVDKLCTENTSYSHKLNDILASS